MYRLLPLNKIKEVRREYRTRLLLGLLIMLIVVGIISVLTILPGYFVSSVEIQTTSMELDSLKKLNADSGVNDLSVAIQDSKEVLGVLGPIVLVTDPSDYIVSIMSHKTGAITLSSFSLDLSVKPILTLAGISATRTSLITFVNDLRGDPHISKADWLKL